MGAKLSKLFELANMLSVKSDIRANIQPLFAIDLYVSS